MPVYIRRLASVYDANAEDFTGHQVFSGTDPRPDTGVIGGTEYVVQEALLSPVTRFTPATAAASLFDFTAAPTNTSNMLSTTPISGGHRVVTDSTKSAKKIWWMVTGLDTAKTYRFSGNRYAVANPDSTHEIRATADSSLSTAIQYNRAVSQSGTTGTTWSPSVDFVPPASTVYVGWSFSTSDIGGDATYDLTAMKLEEVV